MSSRALHWSRKCDLFSAPEWAIWADGELVEGRTVCLQPICACCQWSIDDGLLSGDRVVVAGFSDRVRFLEEFILTAEVAQAGV